MVSSDTISRNYNKDEYSSHATFILKDTKQLDQFQEILDNRSILNDYKLITNRSEYNKIVAPIVKMGKNIVLFQVILIICGGIVLIIMSVVSVSERTYEIGVLRSRGMKKWKVISQFVIENVVIVAFCLIASLSISVFLGQPITDALVNNQVEEQSDVLNQSYNNSYFI